MDLYTKSYYLLVAWLLLISSCKTPHIANHSYEHQTTIGPFFYEINGKSSSCHTQGIAWCDKTNQLIITCQGADKQAYLLLYDGKLKAKSPTTKAIMPLKIITTDADIGNDHPSATQVSKGIFPVAIAGEKGTPTTIYFYQLTKGNMNKIEAAAPILYPGHLGALAYQTIDGVTYLVGVGWDATYLVVWKTTDPSRFTNFKVLYEGKTAAVCNAPIGPYNSIWLGKIDDTDQLTLLTSYGSFYRKKYNFLDVWRFSDEENGLSLNQITSLHVPGYTKETARSLFFEGFTVRQIKNKQLTIWSAPHDFKSTKEFFRMKHIYEGKLELLD